MQNISFSIVVRVRSVVNSPPSSGEALMAKCINTLRPKQNRRHFADDIFKCIFFNDNVWIPIQISLKFVPKGPINNITALVQIMAWRRSGDKPLSGPMMVSLLTHICVTRPQWVKRTLANSRNRQWKGRLKYRSLYAKIKLASIENCLIFHRICKIYQPSRNSYLRLKHKILITHSQQCIWRDQAIAWANVDLSSLMSNDNHLMPISQESSHLSLKLAWILFIWNFFKLARRLCVKNGAQQACFSGQ